MSEISGDQGPLPSAHHEGLAWANGPPWWAFIAAIMRQIGKQILTMALLGLLFAVPARAEGIVTAIVTDPLTGVAIEGYDPVSYFTEPEPLPGTPEFEFYWGGVPWYFATAANRDVFMRAPDIYAPQFGGHCEMSLARGYLSDGKPRIYAVSQMKLYLFYSTANREAFLLSPEDASARARTNWQHLLGNLVGEQAPVIASAAPAGNL